jgi:salicylate hydroxylase
VLDAPVEPAETGDLAYRGTFSVQQMSDFRDERIDELIRASSVQVWMGPQKHVVFYPVKGHTEFNLVLLYARPRPAVMDANSLFADVQIQYLKANE